MKNSTCRNENPQKRDEGRHHLTPETMSEHCRRIISCLEKSKHYLKPDYSLWELSRDTQIPMKTVSRSINHHMGRNFYELINRMRIEAAKDILREMAVSGRNTVIDDVGTRCGFRSRSVFFARFREYEEMTPGKYMSLYENKVTADTP